MTVYLITVETKKGRDNGVRSEVFSSFAAAHEKFLEVCGLKPGEKWAEFGSDIPAGKFYSEGKSVEIIEKTFLGSAPPQLSGTIVGEKCMIVSKGKIIALQG